MFSFLFYLSPHYRKTPTATIFDSKCLNFNLVTPKMLSYAVPRVTVLSRWFRGFFFIILCVKFWLLAAGRLSYLSRPIYAEWTLLSPLLRQAHFLYKECQSNFHYWRCLYVTQLPGSVKNLDTYIFIITIFCTNFYIQCKQCGPRSDAAFCGVRSGSTLFANSPF